MAVNRDSEREHVTRSRSNPGGGRAADVLGDSVRWLERDATQIHLILTEGHTAPALGHAAVVAPDHAEAKRRLRDAGFQVEDTRQLWGADRAFAMAPGGHRVELMAAPPPPKS